MEEESFLIGLAQIGVGFAGFGGLVGIFKHAGSEWLPAEVAGIRLMLEETLALVLASSFPIVLFRVFENRELSLRVASGLLAIFFAYEFFRNLSLSKKFSKMGVKVSHPKRLKYEFLGLTLTFSIVELLNMVFFLSFKPYVIGLFWILYASATQFSFIITRNLPKTTY